MSPPEKETPPAYATGEPQLDLTATEFIRRIAHEVRSPLNVVAGTLKELEGYGDKLAEEHRHMLRLADRQVNRLVRLAEKLSLLAQIEGRRLKLTRQPSELRQVVQRAVDSARALEPRREVSVEVSLGDVPVRIDCDPERIDRALGELIINAVRNARKQVVVSVETGPGEARVRIEDDGDGLADLDRATDRFVPGRRVSGLGIGLSLAADLARAHGGRVEVGQSRLIPQGGQRPGQKLGASISLCLPLVPAGGNLP